MSWGSVKAVIGNRNQLSILMFVAVIMITIMAGLARADTERVIEYVYDGAGNIVQIITQEQSAPPVVSTLNPQFINIGRTISITATGSNLLGVDVVADVIGLSIGAISSSEFELSFELTADNDAPIGDALIRFTTGIGEAQQTIFVAETPPVLSTDPSPIAIEDNNAVTTINLIFSEPRPESETYSISTGDVAIADVSAASFTILAGQTEAQINLTGVSAGVTNFEIFLADKFYTYSFAVYVGATYLQLIGDFPDMLARNLFANSVGVVLQEDRPFPSNAIHATPVGVLVDDISPFSASPIGVFVGDSANHRLFSPLVGVELIDNFNFAFASPVGSIIGPLVDDLNISPLSIDSTVDIEFSGVNLSEVIAVSITPNIDFTINSFPANSTGTLLTVNVTIGIGAVVGLYEIILENVNGPVNTRSGSALMFDIQ